MTQRVQEIVQQTANLQTDELQELVYILIEKSTAKSVSVYQKVQIGDSFVYVVQPPKEKEEKSNQFALIQSLIKSYSQKDLCTGIENPVLWQKSIRDEWEEHIVR